MARADNDAPTLVSLIFPTSVDLTTGSLPSVPFTVDARDAGTGVDHVTIEFDRSYYGYPARAFTIGDGSNFFIEGPVTANAYFNDISGGGVYTIHTVTVADKAGNDASYDTAALAAMGIATTINATSSYARDTTGPTLISLSLPDLNTSEPYNSNIVTGRVSDLGSGFYSGRLTFDSGFGDRSFDVSSEVLSWRLSMQGRRPNLVSTR